MGTKIHKDNMRATTYPAIWLNSKMFVRAILTFGVLPITSCVLINYFIEQKTVVQ